MEKAQIESLYKDVAPKVTSYLVANGTAYSVACDIVQETFIRIWKMREQVDDDDSRIIGLVYTIAKNIRNDKFRHDKNLMYHDEMESLGVASESAAPSPGDDDYLKKRLTAAIAELPPLLRESFLLFQVSELSIREISVQLNITESSVKVRIFRAKTKLKELLADLEAW